MFDLLITDMAMPGLTGEILSKKILNTRPGFPIILWSGYTEHMTQEKASAIGIKKFLQKPVELMNLVEIVHDILIDLPEP